MPVENNICDEVREGVQMSKLKTEMHRRIEASEASAAATGARVSIRRVSCRAAGAASQRVRDALPLPEGYAPTAVHGGPLLGVSFKPLAPPKDARAGAAPAVAPEAQGAGGSDEGASVAAAGKRERLVFYDWTGALQTGAALWLLLVLLSCPDELRVRGPWAHGALATEVLELSSFGSLLVPS
jgi:hypothetical protein